MGSPPSAVSSPPATAPWWYGPLFHLLTAVVVLAAALLGPHLGIDPMEANAAFIAGIGFLGVGVGASASGP